MDYISPRDKDDADNNRQPVTYYLSSREVTSGPHLICNWNAKQLDPLFNYEESLRYDVENARSDADKAYAIACHNEISALKKLSLGRHASSEIAKQSRLDKRSQTNRLEPMTIPKIISQLMAVLAPKSHDEVATSQNQPITRRASTDRNPAIAPPIKKRGSYGQRTLANINNHDYINNDPTN